MKHALILGVGGQDGSYLCEHLLSLGYRVTGTHRRSSVDNLWRIAAVRDNPNLELVEADLCDSGSIAYPLTCRKWDEVYNLADQDHVASSKWTPGYSADVTYGGPARLFEEMMRMNYNNHDVRVFQPSSATIFGDQHTHPCDENAAFNPKSPYAVAKLGALYLARYYRSRGLRVWCGILYGHASTRQKPEYLVHRIAKQAVECVRAGSQRFDIKDSKFRVDVGDAKEFVRGYHAMLQTEVPDDYVLSTGRGVMLWELASHAMYEAGSPVGETFVEMGPVTERCVIGNCSKARAAFGWAPQSNAMDVVETLVDFYSQEKT